MYEWMKKTIEREIRDRIYLAKKSNGYMFYLSVADCLILAFRDAVAYIIVISAILHGEINIWELIMYLGTTTCTSAFFSDLTSNIALMELRSVEINVIRNFLDKEIGSRRDKFFLANDINLEIEFKDVSFKFQENGEYILRHVNLKIDTNSKIAIVGENGAGKSTLIKLICGLYVPTEGKILVNGIDLKKIDIQSYQKLIAVAFQDIYLIPATLGENIAFGEAKFSVDEINECINYAGLVEEKWNLDRMVTNMLDESGLVPSGGQTQKIILSRVVFKFLFRGAKLLILDEPTSAIDPISEKKFYNRYLDLVRKGGCILVSHRMKSTNICDLIIVMENGNIVESGSHSELMKANGLYRKMYDLQSSYYQ